MRIPASSIQTRLVALLTVTLLVGSGIAVASLLTLRSTINGYERLLSTDVQDRESARRMQVTFKKQVQEWKDILLRGEDSASLHKYTTAFHDRAHEVDTLAQALIARADDPVARASVDAFARAHERMGARYEDALTAFVASNGRAQHESDKMVKGQDRAPTDLIDSLVQHFDKRVAAERVDQRATAVAVTRWLAALLVVGFAVSMVVLVVYARALVAPLRALESAAKRVAAGDMSDRDVAKLANTHDDEIGRLAGAFHSMLVSLRSVLLSVDHSASAFESSASALADGTEHLSATTQELHGASESVASGALQQRQGMDTLEAAAEAVATAASMVAEQADKVLQTNELASSRASHGAASATSALERLGEIGEAARGAAEVVKELSQKSERIGEIANGVEQIARQTNLLALNAAIEAARAGDNGAGFAVIAAEVRSLADESAKSLKLIHYLVDDINEASRQVALRVSDVREKVHASESIIGASSELLIRIGGDVTGSRAAAVVIGEDANRLLAQASVLSRELRSVADAADGHSATAQQMSAVAHQQADSTMELAEAGRRMAALAEELRTTLDRFRRAEPSASIHETDQTSPTTTAALRPSDQPRAPFPRSYAATDSRTKVSSNGRPA